MNLTNHGAIRCKQRAISPMAIELLMRFGASEPAGDGASILFFNKHSFRELKAYAGPLAGKLNEYLDIAVIVNSDNEVVTAMHRFKRVNRH